MIYDVKHNYLAQSNFAANLNNGNSKFQRIRVAYHTVYVNLLIQRCKSKILPGSCFRIMFEKLLSVYDCSTLDVKNLFIFKYTCTNIIYGDNMRL